MNWSVILFLSLVVVAFAFIFYFSLPEADKKQGRLNKKIGCSVHNFHGEEKLSDYIKLLSKPSKDFPKISYFGWESKITEEGKE